MTNALYIAAIAQKDPQKTKQILAQEKTSNQKSDYNDLLKNALSTLDTLKEEAEIKELSEIAELLVEAGADINQIDTTSTSPLILHFICLNNKQAVLFLLKHNVKIDYVDPITGLTLLDTATILKHSDIVKLLLSESKNDWYLENPMPLSTCIQPDNEFRGNMMIALYRAAITEKDPQKTKQILEQEKTSDQKSDYNDFLRDALLTLDTLKEEAEIKKLSEIAELLVEAGADINQIYITSPLILHFISVNNKQAVLFLLKHNVKINYVNPTTRRTLLDTAIDLNHLDIIELLLSESKNDWYLANSMPLSTCIQPDNAFNTEMAELLLKYIDVNTFGNHSEPSLFNGIRLKNTTSLAFLITHDADVNLKNKFGQSPLECALKIENYEAARILVDAGANLFSVPQDLIEESQKNSSKEAIQFFTDFKNNQIKQINSQDVIKNFELSDFQNIPVSFLKEPHLQTSLRAHLMKVLQKSKLDKSWIEKMTTLLVQQPTLKVKNTTLLSIIAEFANILLHPEMIDQKGKTLCGPAALLSLLVQKRPEVLFDLGIKLITEGKIQVPLPLTLSSYSMNRATSFIEILLTEIRRAHNLTGYSPESFREEFQGLTPPRLLATWLSSFGLDEVEDLSLPTTARGHTPSKGLYFLLNVAFLKFHANFYRPFHTREENLNYLIQKINDGKEAIVLFSVDWVDEIDRKHTQSQGANLVSSVPHIRTSSILERSFARCFKMPIDHYVLVTNLTSENGQVECEFTTYGKKYKCSMSQNEFLNHYRGAVIANAEKPFQCNDRQENKDEIPKSSRRRLVNGGKLSLNTG